MTFEFGSGSGRQSEIIDNLKVVCPCRGIKKGVFKKLVQNGERSVDRLKEITGATKGDCRGRRCGPRIEEILKYTPEP